MHIAGVKMVMHGFAAWNSKRTGTIRLDILEIYALTDHRFILSSKLF
jgi:hypothetical protein